MTVLREGHSLKRTIRVHGIERDVHVILSHEGISFQVVGTKKAVTQSWGQVIRACNTPATVPSFLMGKPYEFLQWVASKAVKRAIAKYEPARKREETL